MKEAAPAKATFSAAGVAAALLLGGWCGPALGASGISIACADFDGSQDETAITAAPALAAHTETALAEVLDDDDAGKLSALAETASERDVEPLEESDTTEDDRIPGAATPAMITRLPGVSDTVLPSFRRQMYRTDI